MWISICLRNGKFLNILDPKFTILLFEMSNFSKWLQVRLNSTSKGWYVVASKMHIFKTVVCQKR